MCLKEKMAYIILFNYKCHIHQHHVGAAKKSRPSTLSEISYHNITGPL